MNCISWILNILKYYKGGLDTKQISSILGRDATPPDEVSFVSTLATFSPVLIVKEGTSVLWSFADGTTSSSPRPRKNYGKAGVYLNRLKVTPWSGLEIVNLGYDGSDGGCNSIEQVPNQGIAGVNNMHLMASYLRKWCSSYSPIQSLDFNGYANLDTIECFYSTHLVSVSLQRTHNLSRICFENSRLRSIDLSDSLALADFRLAGNQIVSINWGKTGEYLWHLCSHHHPDGRNSNYPTFSNFPNLKELWIWNNNLAGSLVVTSTHLTSALVHNNKFTSACFTGCFPDYCTDGEINISSNQLRKLEIADNPGLIRLFAHNNHLRPSTVESILQILDSFDRHNGMVDLSANSVPTLQGQIYANNLRNKGWLVKVDKNSLDLQANRFFNKLKKIVRRWYDCLLLKLSFLQIHPVS